MIVSYSVPETQMLATSGSATFYTSQSTYPSSEYYEQMVVSVPERPGIIFVPKPATADEEGVVFCNIKGDNVTETNVSIGLDVGGNKYVVLNTKSC